LGYDKAKWNWTNH